MKILQEICLTHTARPPEDPEESKHEAALLGVLLDCSRGIPHTSRRFDVRRSVNDNLKILCGVFGFDAPSHGNLEMTCGVKNLMRGPLEYQYEYVADVKEKLQNGPFGFQTELYETLPAAIINTLPYGVVCSAQVEK